MMSQFMKLCDETDKWEKEYQLHNNQKEATLKDIKRIIYHHIGDGYAFEFNEGNFSIMLPINTKDREVYPEQINAVCEELNCTWKLVYGWDCGCVVKIIFYLGKNGD